MEQNQATSIIELNKPLLAQATFEEHAFSIKLSCFATLGVIAAFVTNYHLAAALFGLTLIEVLIASRLNLLAMEHQMEINEKAVLEKIPPVQNIYHRITNVMHWLGVGTIALGIVAFFVR